MHLPLCHQHGQLAKELSISECEKYMICRNFRNPSVMLQKRRTSPWRIGQRFRSSKKGQIAQNSSITESKSNVEEIKSVHWLRFSLIIFYENHVFEQNKSMSIWGSPCQWLERGGIQGRWNQCRKGFLLRKLAFSQLFPVVKENPTFEGVELKTLEYDFWPLNARLNDRMMDFWRDSSNLASLAMFPSAHGAKQPPLHEVSLGPNRG